MDYTFNTDEPPRGRSFTVVVAIVVAVTIGIILVLRAASPKGGDDGKLREDDLAAKSEASGKPVSAESPEAKSVTERSLPEVRGPHPSKRLVADSKPASAEVGALIEKGQEAERRDDLGAARAAYEAALASQNCGESVPLVENRLGDVMVKLIMSQREMPEKVDHAIVSGDLVAKLARKYGTTAQLISAANGITNPNNIKIGDRLRILDHPNFEIKVSKSENWLLVTLNGKFFKRYTVGTGRYNRTPVGTFKISDKISEPSWWKDNKEIPFGDPENILGTRWMALSATGTTPPAKGYGIHGTWDNTSLGQQSSAGCVRMANEDVEELFIYIPDGATVTIVE